jgi:Tim10/DDP family zinc finger
MRPLLPRSAPNRERVPPQNKCVLGWNNPLLGSRGGTAEIEAYFIFHFPCMSLREPSRSWTSIPTWAASCVSWYSGLFAGREREQMREFFGELSNSCFKKCVRSFKTEGLSKSEQRCMRTCVFKSLVLSNEAELAALYVVNQGPSGSSL